MATESEIRPIIVEKDWEKVALPGLGAGTVVLVTGGTGAIGRRVVQVLLCWGANVAITSRSRARVDEVVAELGGEGRLLGITADVGKEKDGKMAVHI